MAGGIAQRPVGARFDVVAVDGDRGDSFIRGAVEVHLRCAVGRPGHHPGRVVRDCPCTSRGRRGKKAAGIVVASPYGLRRVGQLIRGRRDAKRHRIGIRVRRDRQQVAEAVIRVALIVARGDLPVRHSAERVVDKQLIGPDRLDVSGSVVRIGTNRERLRRVRLHFDRGWRGSDSSVASLRDRRHAQEKCYPDVFHFAPPRRSTSRDRIHGKALQMTNTPRLPIRPLDGRCADCRVVVILSTWMTSKCRTRQSG
jgi:hypothetical protein